jgi:hypothetical protein
MEATFRASASWPIGLLPVKPGIGAHPFVPSQAPNTTRQSFLRNHDRHTNPFLGECLSIGVGAVGTLTHAEQTSCNVMSRRLCADRKSRIGHRLTFAKKHV